MVVVLKGFIQEFEFGMSKYRNLRVDNFSKYKLSSPTGARSASHGLRPRTREGATTVYRI